MRELIFKNLTTPSSKKRDVSVEEIVSRNGMISSTKKRSTYFIRGVHKVKSQKELSEWISKHKTDPTTSKKFFHILREYSSKDKADKLICKMRGSFYIISGQDVYDIVFVHAIRIRLKKPSEVK